MRNDAIVNSKPSASVQALPRCNHMANMQPSTSRLSAISLQRTCSLCRDNRFGCVDVSDGDENENNSR